MACVAQSRSSESHGGFAPKHKSPVTWAIGLASLLALSGWGAFAYGFATQQRLMAERDRASAEAADLRASREQLTDVYVKNLGQLAAAQNEVVMLRSRLETPQPASPVMASPSSPLPGTKRPPSASAGSHAGAPPPISPILRVFLPPPPRA